MKNAEITIEFITPALLAGADQTTAEFRIPSIKGQLRWWCNALYPETEWNDIFGFAEGKNSKKSSIIITELNSSISTKKNLTGEQIASKNDYFLWPIRKENLRGIINEKSKVTFSIRTRVGGTPLPDNALKAFLLLASLGSRSRRAYGSIWPTKVVIDNVDWKIPTTIDDFLDELDNGIPSDTKFCIIQVDKPQKNTKDAIDKCKNFLKSFRCGSIKSGTPSFYGKNDHDAPFNNDIEDVYRPALGLPLTQQYSSGKVIETTCQEWERLASPIHFKIIPLEGQFIPIAIIFIDDLLDNGKKLIIAKGKKEEKCVYLNLDLLETICNPDSKDHKDIWPHSKELLPFGVVEE